ncbi:TlpA disulfide reductase family protein [Flavivirga spongiicola]|uniref:AhpC/TSA family protein n=1 Tax=Flavivirga spongiicola TaxID=421621 RepID=A0ABU7XXU7_9FLAO|nr:TlpA disulfide reductase family protein [Flavivirga sp. MEBiC05379]MDO5979684.1 TlpA disulfide reductase family protein [Flavivirga sp. MEBiC05379]
MKLTNIIKLFIITLIISSCGEKQKPLEEGMYRINGTVNGLENGDIYLTNFPNPTDTIKVVKGKFTLEKELKEVVGKVNLTKDASIKYMDSKLMISFFIEPSIMTLDLNYEDFSKSKLMGSKTQDEQYQLDEIRSKIAANYKAEQDAFETVRKKYDDATKAGASEEELEAIKYEDNEARGKLAPMWEEQGKVTLQFIKDNPKSFVSVQSLMFQLGHIQYDEAKAILDQFNPAHLKIGIGARLAKDIEDMRKGIPGALAGNFNTVDINGSPLKLEDFKDKYLLIDFWASWCVPCRKGNPHLISLFEKYNQKGLEILGVSDDDRDHDKWRKAVEKDQIGIWHHVLRGLEYDPETRRQINKHKDISNGYNISSLPTKILVNPDGVIIGRYGGGGGTDDDMDRDLAKLFIE